jgi:hypothetical protein
MNRAPLCPALWSFTVPLKAHVAVIDEIARRAVKLTARKRELREAYELIGVRINKRTGEVKLVSMVPESHWMSGHVKKLMISLDARKKD